MFSLVVAYWKSHSSSLINPEEKHRHTQNTCHDGFWIIQFRNSKLSIFSRADENSQQPTSVSECRLKTDLVARHVKLCTEITNYVSCSFPLLSRALLFNVRHPLFFWKEISARCMREIFPLLSFEINTKMKILTFFPMQKWNFSLSRRSLLEQHALAFNDWEFPLNPLHYRHFEETHVVVAASGKAFFTLD